MDGSTPTAMKQSKKNFLTKTWERCRSIPGGGGRDNKADKPVSAGGLSKRKSWQDNKAGKEKKHQVMAPGGCFPVYVGPEKQRFDVKTKYANHPLFIMLLEDAEMEYGYHSDGPISLPCDVDLFYRVLAEMKGGGGVEDDEEVERRRQVNHGCGFAYGACSPFNNPSRRLGNSEIMRKGYGSYGLLTPSRFGY